MHLYFDYLLIIQVRLWGPHLRLFGEDPEGGFIKFMVKRASKQDQALHMERKLHIILYFREEWAMEFRQTTAGLLATIRLYLIPA